MQLGPEDEKAINDIVDRSVKATLFNLNIDVSSPEKILEFRQRMDDVADWSRAAKNVKSAFTVSMVGTAAAGLIALLLMGVRAWFFREPPH